MAGQRYEQRVSTDRFGNPSVLKFAADVFNRKSGEIVQGVGKTYVELGNQLYKVEVSRAQKVKQTKYGDREGFWVKITKCSKRSASSARM